MCDHKHLLKWTDGSYYCIDCETKFKISPVEEDVEEPDPLFYATCGVCSTSFQNDKPIDNIFCHVCRELKYTMLGVLNSGPVPGRRPKIDKVPTLPDSDEVNPHDY
jgi:hypothetical protein